MEGDGRGEERKTMGRGRGGTDGQTEGGGVVFVAVVM